MTEPTVTYQFEASRFYSEDERYCSGSGLSFFTSDLAHASAVFNAYQRDSREGAYAVSVSRCDTNEVLMHSGPSREAAKSSMNRAWSRRYRADRNTAKREALHLVG